MESLDSQPEGSPPDREGTAHSGNGIGTDEIPFVLCAVFENMVDAVVVIDETGAICLANLACERMFGYPAHELMGRGVGMLMPHTERASHDGHLARYRATGVKSIIGIGREVSGRKSDGSELALDLAIAEVRLPSRRLFAGVLRDVGARRESERQLIRALTLNREILECVADGVALLDLEWRYSIWNGAMARLTGLGGGDVIGRSVFDVFPDAAALGLEALLRAAREGESVDGPVIGRVRGTTRQFPDDAVPEGLRDGDIVWTQASYLPHRSTSDAVEGIIEVVHDVTSLKAAADAAQRHSAILRDLAAQREQAREDERTHLARELHDDVGGLLSAARFDLDRLQFGIPERRGDLTRIAAILETAMLSIRRLVQDLRPPAIELLGLWQAVDLLGRDASIRHRFRFDCDLTAALASVTLPDRIGFAVYRIVQEALTNIGRHAHAREVKLTGVRDGVAIELILSDDGCGFETPASADRMHWGLLGMSERAAQLGGALTIHSALGSGTTVRLVVPVE